MHYDDLLGPWAQVAFGMVVVLGYCLFFASWVGLGAGLFALTWRWCGAWILGPLVGAVLGAAAAIGLGLLVLRGIDLRGAGAHGGGDIAAFLLLGLLAIAAVLGAILGGALAGALTLIVALATRSRRQALVQPTTNAENE